MQRSEPDMWKGYALLIEGIRKGRPFRQKWYLKKKWVRPRGGASPYKTLLSTPPAPFSVLLLGPLDRGCQELIIPACKDLGVYSHTLLSESVQKHLYLTLWRKSYNKSDLQRDFPKVFENIFANYPKCRRNAETLFCGEMFPPCFLHETKAVYKTPCRSVCNDIARECPGYFR